MNAPKLDVKGWLMLAAVGLGLYLVYKFVQGGAGVVSALNSFGEDLGGDAYTLVNGDANAELQSNFQKFLAAWKAAGSPATGSAPEIALREQYGIPLPPGQVDSGNSGSS